MPLLHSPVIPAPTLPGSHTEPVPDVGRGDDRDELSQVEAGPAILHAAPSRWKANGYTTGETYYALTDATDSQPAAHLGQSIPTERRAVAGYHGEQTPAPGEVRVSDPVAEVTVTAPQPAPTRARAGYDSSDPTARRSRWQRFLFTRPMDAGTADTFVATRAGLPSPVATGPRDFDGVAHGATPVGGLSAQPTVPYDGIGVSVPGVRLLPAPYWTEGVVQSAPAAAAAGDLGSLAASTQAARMRLR